MDVRKTVLIMSLLLILGLLSACNMPADTTDEPYDSQPDGSTSTESPTLQQLARIDSVQVQVLESFPVQIKLLINGTLPDGCTTIDEITRVKDGNQFLVMISTVRSEQEDCTTALVPFTETIALDVEGLPEGEYIVNINGYLTSFMLQTGNSIIEDPAQEVGTGSITGRVFHDECGIVRDSDATIIYTSDGCIEDGDTFRANGSWEEPERGIANIVMQLGQGECPSTGFAEVVSDAKGRFDFTDLNFGFYCLSINPQDVRHSTLLIPGIFTLPNTEGQIQIAIQNTEPENILFGWDYELLPIINPPECSNEAIFVDDVTIPDGTEFSPGASFSKTWRVRNAGTCSWSPDYALTFVGGDQLGAPATIALSATVNPGESVDLTVPLTAPSAEGSYRGDWKIQNEDGEVFGTGTNGQGSMWFEIIIATGTVGPNLGDPDHVEHFNSAGAWYTGQDAHTGFSVENGAMVMVATSPENWDGWTVSATSLSNFHIEMKAEIQSCSGLDRYGLMLRSPDLNRGYLIGFSCDGRYSVRIWDGSAFQVVKNWTSSGHIHTGSNQTNRLGVAANGNSFAVYANDMLLAEFNDSTFYEGRFGLFVASASSNNLTVKVDKVSYWLP